MIVISVVVAVAAIIGVTLYMILVAKDKCDKNNVIKCAQKSDDDVDAPLDNVTCANGDWQCKEGYCELTTSVSCIDDQGNTHPATCESGRWTCPDDTCLADKGQQCLMRNKDDDNLMISSPRCHKGDLICQGKRGASTGILCDNPHPDSPLPLCMSWNPEHQLQGAINKGSYETSCPVWDDETSKWTCQDYFSWGERRSPHSSNADIETSVGNIMVTPDKTPDDATPIRYYPGYLGVIDGSGASRYDPNHGTLAYCQDQKSTAYCRKDGTPRACMGGRFDSHRSAEIFPSGQNENGTTTGYRIVSVNSNPYYYELDNTNGDSFCAAAPNDKPFQSNNADAMPQANANDLDSCRGQCSTDDHCYMYVYKSKEAENDRCTTYRKSNYGADGTEKFIRNLEPAHTSRRSP